MLAYAIWKQACMSDQSKVHFYASRCVALIFPRLPKALKLSRPPGAKREAISDLFHLIRRRKLRGKMFMSRRPISTMNLELYCLSIASNLVRCRN